MVSRHSGEIVANLPFPKRPALRALMRAMGTLFPTPFPISPPSGEGKGHNRATRLRDYGAERRYRVMALSGPRSQKNMARPGQSPIVQTTLFSDHNGGYRIPISDTFPTFFQGG